MVRAIESVVEAAATRWEVPGLAIGILHDGQVEFGGYGVASLETGQPVVPETLFQIGSISKPFTATLVMTLVEEGRLDLDTPVVTYAPELPLADSVTRAGVTLRHLFTHMAGFLGDRFDDHGAGDDALARAVAAFGDLPQQTELGEVWTYCNAGFDLAGRCVERVLGVPFEVAMRERVFEPLGLERSTYFAAEAIRHPVAVGHVPHPEDGWQVADPWPIPRRSNPAGGITTNVAELLRFAAMHNRDGAIGKTRLLQPESVRMMREVHASGDYGRPWGLGWIVQEIGGRLVLEHGGATNGFKAQLLTIPELDFALAILTNGWLGDATNREITAAALDAYAGLRRPDAAPAIPFDRDHWQPLAGRYSSLIIDIAIDLGPEGLSIVQTWKDPFSGITTVREAVRALPLSPSLLRIEEGPLKGSVIEWFFNDDGSVRFIRMGGRLLFPER